MTKVYCEQYDCKYNVKGKCSRRTVKLVISYGRTTDYAEEFLCKNYTPKEAMVE